MTFFQLQLHDSKCIQSCEVSDPYFIHKNQHFYGFNVFQYSTCCNALCYMIIFICVPLSHSVNKAECPDELEVKALLIEVIVCHMPTGSSSK